MKIAALVREQRRLLLRRALAIPNGYLQNPIVAAFVTKVVEHMEAVFRALRDNPKGESERKLSMKSYAFARQSEGHATP
jgi:hypothetical protein